MIRLPDQFDDELPRVRRPVTMAALACLRRIRKSDGVLVRNQKGPLGWRVVGAGSLVFYWFPPYAGDELLSLGFVNQKGLITHEGLLSLERKKNERH